MVIVDNTIENEKEFESKSNIWISSQFGYNSESG